MQLPESWRNGQVDPKKLKKGKRNVVQNDRWDRADMQRMREEMSSLTAATEQLGEHVPTAEPFMSDAWYGFFKVDPQLEDLADIQPDHAVNHMVMEQALQLPEVMQDVRRQTRGDDVAAAMAVVKAEPEFETLFDRLAKRQQQAEELQEQMQNFADAQAESQDLDDMIERWTAENEPEEGEEQTEEQQEQAAAYAQQQQDMADKLAEMQQELSDAADELEDGLTQDAPSVSGALRRTMRQIGQELADMQAQAEAWGTSKGDWQKMSANQRLDMAKRMDNPKIQKAAELFGRMHNVYWTEQARRVDHSIEEIFDVTQGDNLERVLPEELVKLADEDRELEFLVDFAEGKLLQFEMRGTEKIGRGGIICCKDSSYSMAGEKDIFATAMMLVLLHICRKEGRSFKVITFGSRDEHLEHTFMKPSDFTTDKILEIAEIFMASGTDFETPLDKALAHLQMEHSSDGKVEGDIVFITDGICGVSERWMSAFKAEQKRLEFYVWGVAIGVPKTSEPLHEICDGRVATVRDLMSGGDVKEIFRGI